MTVEPSVVPQKDNNGTNGTVRAIPKPGLKAGRASVGGAASGAPVDLTSLKKAKEATTAKPTTLVANQAVPPTPTVDSPRPNPPPSPTRAGASAAPGASRDDAMDDAMEPSKRLLGAEHPDTLTSKANLAATYRRQGRWNEAEKLEVDVGDNTMDKVMATEQWRDNVQQHEFANDDEDVRSFLLSLFTHYNSQK